MSAIIDLLESNPWLLVAAVIALRTLLAYQRGLSWPEYRTLHALKRRVFPPLDRIEPLGYRWFVLDKQGRGHADFLATVDESPSEVLRTLEASGGDFHLLSSMKRRPEDNGDPYHAGDILWLHGDGRQTHAYVFENSDGTTDLYAHEESDVTRPVDHLSGEQTHGDPRGVVTDALGLEKPAVKVTGLD